MKFLFVGMLILALVFAVQSSQVIELTDHNFYDYLSTNSERRVMVKFYAPWCGHCKTLAPTFDLLADHANSDDNSLAFAKVDCTVNKVTCKQYEVKGYPTMKLFHGMKYVDYTGGRSFDEILQQTKALVTTQDVQYTLPPEIQEVLNDLNEIWRIRRNALGVIVFISALIGMILSCLCCAKKTKKVDDAKIKKD